MATGYFSAGVCYALQNDAIDAYFHKFSPASFASSASEQYHIVSYLAGSNPHSYQMLTFQINNQTSPYRQLQRPTYSLQTPLFASCDVPNDPTTNFLDGMELGWAVASVMVIVFAIRRTYRGF